MAPPKGPRRKNLWAGARQQPRPKRQPSVTVTISAGSDDEKSPASIASSETSSKPKSATRTTSISCSAVHGLPCHRHLTLKRFQAQWQGWKKDMLFSFRAHGILDTMQGALFPYWDDDFIDDDEDAREQLLNTEHSVRSGFANLSIWDDSEDMTLLFRANALIDASIDEDLAAWVHGIENPHEKWRSLEEIYAAANPKTERHEDNRLSRKWETLRLSEFSNVRDYVEAFMKHRAEIGARCDAHLQDHIDKHTLVKKAAEVLPGLSTALEEKLGLSNRGGVTRGDRLTLAGFAAEFITEAQRFWDASTEVRSSLL